MSQDLVGSYAICFQNWITTKVFLNSVNLYFRHCLFYHQKQSHC